MRFKKIRVFSLDADCIVPHLLLFHEHRSLSLSAYFSGLLSETALFTFLVVYSASILFAKADKILLRPRLVLFITENRTILRKAIREAKHIDNERDCYEPTALQICKMSIAEPAYDEIVCTRRE